MSTSEVYKSCQELSLMDDREDEFSVGAKNSSASNPMDKIQRNVPKERKCNIPVKLCRKIMKRKFIEPKRIRYPSLKIYNRKSREKLRKCKFPFKYPIGVCYGTENFTELEVPTELFPITGYASCFIAFGELFITPENTWDSQTVDRVLKEGRNLIRSCRREEEILTETENTKTFKLCGNLMTVRLSEPVLIGSIDSCDSRVDDIEEGLRKFFTLYDLQYCLMSVDGYSFLIWNKEPSYFYLFDSYGRDSQNYERDTVNGKSILLAVNGLTNLVCLLKTRSSLNRNATYILREIQMQELLPCCDHHQVKKRPKIIERKQEFQIINDKHCVLYGNIHCGSECFGEQRYQQGLAIGITALIFSKIDPACTWDCCVLREILIQGNGFHEKWSKECSVSIENIPEIFEFGQFRVYTRIVPYAFSGNLKNVPNFRGTDLWFDLIQSFETDLRNRLILEIGNRIFALWKSGNYFYFWNSYPPRTSLHMIASLDMLCCFLTQDLEHEICDSIKTKYSLHSIRILKVENKQNFHCLDEHVNFDEEIASLNEFIDFENTDLEILDCISVAGLDDKSECKFADLDSPTLSQTQFQISYNEYKEKILGGKKTNDEETTTTEDEDTTTELEESDDTDTESELSLGLSGLAKKRNKKKPTKKSEKKLKPIKKQIKKIRIHGQKNTESATETEDETSEMEDDENTETNIQKSRKKGTKSKNQKVQKEKTFNDGNSNENGDETDAMKTIKSKKIRKEKPNKKTKIKENKLKNKENKLKANEKKMENKKLERNAEKRLTDKERKRKKKERVGKTKKEKLKKLDKKKREKIKKRLRKGTGTDYSWATDETDESIRENEEPTRLQTLEPGDDNKDDEKLKGSDDASGCGDFETHVPKGCIPDKYPGQSSTLKNLAVIASEGGSYESLCSLLKTALKLTDRVLTMTPWRNYVVFTSKNSFFLYDGCTCRVERFRRLDLSVGTAGLLCFRNSHQLIMEIRKGCDIEHRKTISRDLETTSEIIRKICSEYCDDNI